MFNRLIFLKLNIFIIRLVGWYNNDSYISQFFMYGSVVTFIYFVTLNID